MISRREGQSDFLDKVVNDIVEKSEGTKKTASDNVGIGTNHPAAKLDVVATGGSSTNHPAEKIAEDEKKADELSTEKTAGSIAGPGIPDGTGPCADTPECQMNIKTGPGGHIPDGTGPHGMGRGPGNGKGDGSGMARSSENEMTLHQARVARREGRFAKVAGRNDLYQEASTNAFWKISDDKQKVIRTFEDNNGVVAE